MIKKFKKITTLFATFIALASLFNVCASAKAYGDDVIVSDDGIVETIEYITYYKLPKEDKKECKADYEKIKEGVKKYDKNAPLDENELNMYIREKFKQQAKWILRIQSELHRYLFRGYYLIVYGCKDRILLIHL